MFEDPSSTAAGAFVGVASIWAPTEEVAADVFIESAARSLCLDADPSDDNDSAA